MSLNHLREIQLLGAYAGSGDLDQTLNEDNGWRVNSAVVEESGLETLQSIVLWRNANTVCHAAMCFFVLQEHPFCSPLMSEHLVFFLIIRRVNE